MRGGQGSPRSVFEMGAEPGPSWGPRGLSRLTWRHPEVRGATATSDLSCRPILYGALSKPWGELSFSVCLQSAYHLEGARPPEQLLPEWGGEGQISVLGRAWVGWAGPTQAWCVAFF